MAFSNNNTTDSTKTVSKTYTIRKNDVFENESDIPWKNERSQIKYVDFVNTIVPTNTKRWFHSCSNLEEIEHITNLNTSQVTNMSWMFANCTRLSELDLRSFNTKKVQDMSYMFIGATGIDGDPYEWGTQTKMTLTNIDVSSFDTKNVTNMCGMFANCNYLTDLDLSVFDTSKVTNMSYMFSVPFNAPTKLESITFGQKFDVSKVVNMQLMFSCQNKLKNIYVSNDFITNIELDSSLMFNDCTSLVGGNGTIYNSTKTDQEYARIDKVGQVGYFTDIRQDLAENNTEFEYIESTGTQYIDTRIKPSMQTKVVLDYQFLGADNEQNQVGCGDANDNSRFVIAYLPGSTYFYFGIGKGITTTYTKDYNRHIFMIDMVNKEYGIDNNKYNFDISNIYTEYTFSLFARHDSSNGYSFKGQNRLYNAQIYEDGALIRDFVPAHNTITNSAGLYDTIEKRFYPNNGTGTFIEGPEKTNN